MYRFRIYNIDEFGNQSIPVETTAIPYTTEDLNALVLPSPMQIISPVSAEFNWINGLSSGFFDFAGVTYSYTDHNGFHSNSITNTEFVILNLNTGETVEVNITCRIIPKISNNPIIDTVDMDRTITFTTVTPEEYLEQRVKRTVTEASISGTEGSVIWGESTDHLVASEVRYETNAGVKNISRILSTQTTLVCDDTKPGGLIETRSVFVPTAAVDTFYSEWKIYEYPFLYKYPRAGWTAVSRNGNHGWGDGGGGQPALIFDGNVATGWHSRVGAPLPQCIVVDMKQSLPVDHITLYPPGEVSWRYLKDIEIYLSDTPMDPTGANVPDPLWGNPKVKLEYNNATFQNINFPAGSSGRYMALVFPTSTSGNTYISFMELVVFGF
jgi:hypothetical protein